MSNTPLVTVPQEVTEIRPAPYIQSGCIVSLSLALTGLLVQAFGSYGIGNALYAIAAMWLVLSLSVARKMGTAQYLVGPCPACATSIRAEANLPGVDCPGCKKRIVIRDKKYLVFP